MAWTLGIDGAMGVIRWVRSVHATILWKMGLVSLLLNRRIRGCMTAIFMMSLGVLTGVTLTKDLTADLLQYL